MSRRGRKSSGKFWILSALVVGVFPLVFFLLGGLAWWDRYQCSANAFVRSDADVIETAIPVAMNSYKTIFSQQSIFTTNELMAAYPECCTVEKPGKDVETHTGTKPEWIASIAVTSPCSKRRLVFHVPVDRCGATDDAWFARAEDRTEEPPQEGDDLCRG